MKYIKSPFNYVGGKYKQLNQLLPYFPSDASEFVDLFGGGFNVGLNVDYDVVRYNDTITPLVELWEYFYAHDVEEMLKYIKESITLYALSDKNTETFKFFRNHYNNQTDKHPLDLYILTCFSYNDQMRFNNNYEYNAGHGKNRSSFNSNLEKRFISSIYALQEKKVSFTNKHFTKIKDYTTDSFVYCDPPYFLSTAYYTDGKRGFGGWTQKDEKLLYKYLTELNERDVLFGLSNIICKDDKTNNYLLDFITENNFKTHRINSNYNNCSYNRKKSETVEVYVTNANTII